MLGSLYKRIDVPDGVHPSAAAGRADTIGIGCHPDDIEILSWPFIRDCFLQHRFFGIVATNGANSPRQGRYRDVSDFAMAEIRRVEQRKAAEIGRYSGVAQLGHTSAEAKSPEDETIIDELTLLIEAIEPRVIVTHQPFDKHPSHCGLMWKVVEAVRRLGSEYKPELFLGGQVWGPLAFLPPQFIKILDATDKDGLLPRLLAAFESQCIGGKRYDVAVPAMFAANRTFAESHEVDGDADTIMFALDLMPLIGNPALDRDGFLQMHLRAFEEDVMERNRAVTPLCIGGLTGGHRSEQAERKHPTLRNHRRHQAHREEHK